MPHTPRRCVLTSVFLAGLAIGCSEPDRVPVTPVIRDGGSTTNADGGPAIDGGTNVDGGTTSDAGTEPEGPAWWRVDDPAAAGLRFTRIVATGPDDVYLLGQSNNASTVLHYDGQAFTPVTVDTGRCGGGIADIGLAGDDLVVYPSSCGLGIARRTQGVWSFLEFERNIGTNVRSLWVGPDVYWVTGLGATFEVELDGTVTDYGGINLGGTFSVSGTARDDVYVGGQFGAGHFDGMNMTRVEGGREIFARARDDVWSLTFIDMETLTVVRGNGVDPTTTWRLEVPMPGGRIHANGDSVWLAAGEGVVHQFLNGVFIAHELPATTPRLRQVFVVAEDDVWFAGEDGAIVRYTSAKLEAPAVPIDVISAEVPEPIEPQPGVGRMRLVNASGEGVRFCSSTGGRLTTADLTANDTSVGFFDVNIGANPQVTSFGVWIEPTTEPQCRNSGITFNRQTVFITGGQNVTVYGTLDPEDRIALVNDRYAMLDAGQASLRVVRIGPVSDPIDVCAAGAPLAAGVRANSRSPRFGLASSVATIEVRAAAQPACSGTEIQTLQVSLSDRTSHSLVLDSGAALLCSDATTDVGRDASTCVRL